MGGVSPSQILDSTRHCKTLAHHHSRASRAASRNITWGSGAGSNSGGASTSTGGVWAERRRDRIQSNKDLIRAMLDFDDDDDAGEARREFEGMEELERAEEDGSRMRRRCAPVAAVAAGIASWMMRPVFRRGGAKTIEASSLSTSCHAHTQPLPDLIRSHIHTLSEFHLSHIFIRSRYHLLALSLNRHLAFSYNRIIALSSRTI